MSAQLNNSIRVYLIEDSKVTREAIKALLAQVTGLELVGEAGDGETALSGAESLSPDILIADIGLPWRNGIATIRDLKDKLPECKALMLTASDSDDDLFESFAAGAEGYILKTNLTARRLELAVRTVQEGSVWLDPQLASRVLKAASTKTRPECPLIEPLSAPERDLLSKVAGNEAPCKDGVCQIDPEFLERLNRFSRQRGAATSNS